jgi:hypothetical protein
LENQNEIKKYTPNDVDENTKSVLQKIGVEFSLDKKDNSNFKKI